MTVTKANCICVVCHLLVHTECVQDVSGGFLPTPRAATDAPMALPLLPGLGNPKGSSWVEFGL